MRAAFDEGFVPHILVLLCLDGGLRVGEALGLRWQAIEWGDDRDPNRALRIEEARPRGGEPTAPKSGRSRRVALSHRLRWGLLELYQSYDASPQPRDLVLAGIDVSNFRTREWRRILKRADIGHRTIKDLRDTFASQLLTAGVQLGYVSSQLGHSDVSVTARHYAGWIEGDGYREPMNIQPGEVPADLLARLGGEKSDPTSDLSTQVGVVSDSDKSPQVPVQPWKSMARREGRDPALPDCAGKRSLAANPRSLRGADTICSLIGHRSPSGSKPDALRRPFGCRHLLFVARSLEGRARRVRRNFCERD